MSRGLEYFGPENDGEDLESKRRCRDYFINLVENLVANLVGNIES